MAHMVPFSIYVWGLELELSKESFENPNMFIQAGNKFQDPNIPHARTLEIAVKRVFSFSKEPFKTSP